MQSTLVAHRKLSRPVGAALQVIGRKGVALKYWRRSVQGLLATGAIVLALAGSAQAGHNYWNVWHDNLPDGSGVRAKHTAYNGAGQAWVVRESWTADSHDMNFLLIRSDGGWESYSALIYGTPVTSAWDRVVGYQGYARAGCQNPQGATTVWVNCRNAETY